MSPLLQRVKDLERELGRAPTAKELSARKVWNSGGGGYPNLSCLFAAAGIAFWTKMDRRYGKKLPPFVMEELQKMAERLGRPPRHREVLVINLWAPGRYGFATLKALLEHLGMTPKRDSKPWTTAKRESFVAYLKRRQKVERRAATASATPKQAEVVRPVAPPKTPTAPILTFTRPRERDILLEPSWMDEAVA